MYKRLLPDWRIASAILAVLSVFAALVFTGSSASAATSSGPGLSITLSDTSSVVGEAIDVSATVSPPTSNLAVKVEEWSPTTKTWVYVGPAIAKTNSLGFARILFTGRHSGARWLRVSTVIKGKTITSLSDTMTVYPNPASPGPTATLNDDGELVVELAMQICDSVSHLFDVGALTGPEAAFVATFWKTWYSESQCHNVNNSEAIKNALIDALWAYPFEKAGDTAAEAAWGDALKAILDRARVDEIGLNSKFAVTIWNSWILQDIERLARQSAACVLAYASSILVSQCNTFPQEAALEAQMIR